MTQKKKSMSFPATDVKFDLAFKALMVHLGLADPDSGSTTVTWTRLGLDATTVYNVLVALLGTSTTVNTWLYVYPLEKNKATHTTTLKDQKNALKKKILAIVRAQRIIVKDKDHATPGFLTATDKQCFFISAEANPRTSSIATFRTAHPVPVLSIQLIKHLLHVVDGRDPETPKSTSLPAGMYFIQLKRFIGTVAPTDVRQYDDLVFSGKFRNSSHFTAANEKQTAWYIGRYISTTGDVGDWSAPITATIASLV
ncbi:MAG TPA: hypothetical protein VF411_15915 [Bacteroidia bacterium]